MPVGPAVSFHGMRVPYQVSIDQARERFPSLARLADEAAADAISALPLLRVHQRA